MKIILDAMGGDYAPKETVLGAIDALKLDKDIKLVLVGNSEAINKQLAECEYDKSRIEIIDAQDEIQTTKVLQWL